jgi:di/tricarboxylate transporter
MFLVFLILAIAIVLFLSNRLRPDVIAVLVMLALGLSGLLNAAEVFSGFSRSAVITIMAIFILAEGLRRTGVTDMLGEALLRLAGKRESNLVLMVTLAGATLSLFMNNIAAASVLMPAIQGIGRKAGVSPSRLLMPLAFGTILGGMATLLTTTNILVSGILRQYELEGFGLFDFAAVGIPIVLFGTLYMALLGRKLLPAQAHPVPEEHNRTTESSLEELYHLEQRQLKGRVFKGSALAGQPVRNCQLRERFKLNLVAIQREGQTLSNIGPDTIIQPGDVLHLIGRTDSIAPDELKTLLELLPDLDHQAPPLALVEAVLPPRSLFVGQTLRQIHFREKYNLNVLAIWREGRPYRTGHGDMPLKFGDALLLQGTPEKIAILQSEPQLLVLSRRSTVTQPQKALLAGLIFLLTLIASAIGSLPISEVMLTGAMVMVLLGVLNMDQAYQAIEWKSVFLIAGMLPLGTALDKTGAAALLGQALLSVVGHNSWLIVLAVLLGVTIAFTQVMNGPAVAAILAPIAIQIAHVIGADPRALAMIVALATSIAFITPLGHPVNVLVMGPGGYKFGDYAKVGLPLTVILFVVILLFLPLFWPLY